MPSVSKFFAASRELGRLLARDQDPVTFVLGAGASISSGAPTTAAVEAVLDSAMGVRLGDEVRRGLDRVVDSEVRKSIEPLFRGIEPNAGYRLLAALGRDRRINIVNLNWDAAAARAAQQIGVDCASLDAREGAEGVGRAVAQLPARAGLLVVHAHGTLNQRPRFSDVETLPDSDIWGAIRPLLEQTTVVCGASLSDERDIEAALQTLRRSGTSGPPVWIFSRETIPGLSKTWTQVIDPTVDFDALVIALAEEIWHEREFPMARWDDLRRRYIWLDLPKACDLGELEGSLRTRLLASRVGALVARPHVGKTVGALRLAHLELLSRAPHGRLRCFFDDQDAASSIVLAQGEPDLVLFIDDPFGANEPRANPLVPEQLIALAAESSTSVYLASRASNWSRGVGELEFKGLAVSSQEADDWYSREELDRLARLDASESTSRVRAVQSGQATTPADFEESQESGEKRSDGGRERDARSLIDSDPQLGLLCALVRLQEFRSRSITETEARAVLGEGVTDRENAGSLLVRYPMNEDWQFAFRHPTVEEIVDDYLLEHDAGIELDLSRTGHTPTWIGRALDSWRIQRELISPAESRFALRQPAPADWIAERFARNPGLQVIEEALSLDLDQWHLMELGYEVVRLWPEIARLENAVPILDEFLGRPMGAYAILEGCLYFQLKASDELWARVAKRLWDLDRDPSRCFERVLALDGVLWRKPQSSVHDWARQAFEALDVRDPEFGFVRFAGAYHPEGLAALDPKRVLDLDAEHQWTNEQAKLAARLVAWHHGHQSRARALARRFDADEKVWLCQSSFSGDRTEGFDPQPAARLARSLASRTATAGWAFHVLCNLAAITELDLDLPELREIIRTSIEKAPLGDPGLVSAVLTYEPARRFQQQLRARTERLGEREHYWQALGFGTRYEDIDVGPPRFNFIYDAEAVRLTYAEPKRGLPSEIASATLAEVSASLTEAAGRVAIDSSFETRLRVGHLIERCERGDMGELVMARSQAGETSYFESAIRFWIEDPSRGSEALPSASDGKLFS